MKLGNRLQTITSKIPKGLTVVDVGTDHAYLPIYLVNKGISKKVIATEILPGPYRKAQKNITKAGLQDFIDLRLGPGFNTINPAEADIAVIAGMGAMTIINIINESRQVADSVEKLILQPMKNPAELRKYLFKIGYKIIDEDVTWEDDKFYEIIVVRKANLSPFDETDIIVGPVIRNKKNPVIIEYINYRINILQGIIKDLKVSDTKACQKAVLKYEKLLKTLEEVIK